LEFDFPVNDYQYGVKTQEEKNNDGDKDFFSS